MNSLFPKLALTGIKKNSKLYIPYILSCIGSVTMFFIIQELSVNENVANLRGGDTLVMAFTLGKFVIAFFSLLFLLYTNSFLVRRRNREFGLYNILGMNKKDITKVISWEALIVMGISLVGGLFFGILLSKLSEMLLLYMVKTQADFSFSLTPSSLGLTTGIFLVIFTVLYIKSVATVRKTDILGLMHSEKTGEKQPKANWIFAIMGVVVLGAAYYISVSTESPIAALMLFFVAVIMVIIATYLLFISGSVALCKSLQKNKKYYYKKNHFVSVSSMTYRMKRNGAGLASICILSTMVLVMIGSSASLYFGAEEALATRYPRHNELQIEVNTVDNLTPENLSLAKKEYEKVFDKHKIIATDIMEFSSAQITGALTDNPEKDYLRAETDSEIDAIANMKNVRTLYFIPVSDYNKATGSDLKVTGNQAYCFTVRCDFDLPEFNMNGVHLKMLGKADKRIEIGSVNADVMPTIVFIVSDLNVIKPLESLCYHGTDDPMIEIMWYYGYNLPEVNQQAVDICKEQIDAMGKLKFMRDSDGGYQYRGSSLAAERDDFYTNFGGLFFIGILLSIVFIFAMAMIIYYKQISEGYEDVSRFGIMQKVGMTKQDIKRSINSQVLTVFFAPLIFAGVHFCFAFPPIWKILKLFGLSNMPFVAMVSAIAFVIFGIIYAFIYKATAKSYYNIVSSAE